MNNKPHSVLCSLIFLVAASVLGSPLASAAEYCGGRFVDKTIRWIVPSSPGGGYDTYSRLIAPYYEKYTGAQLVVQNRPGAGGRVGATKIMQAEPDGLTIGILNGPGLTMGALFETPPMPNPATDFTILGRVAKNRHVWAVAADSPLPDLESVLEASRSKPIVFGTRGPGTLSFVDIVVTSWILDLNIDIVTGYDGSRDGILGALRGDVDAVAHSHGSLAEAFRAGEMRPWLQVTDGPINDSSIFEGVPWLAGEDGLAVRAARRRGGDRDEAVARAKALVELTAAGRLIAAPHGLDDDLTHCMRDALHAALTDEAFAKAVADAGRPLHVSRGQEAAAQLEAIQPQVKRFVPALERATEQYGK